MEIKFIQNYTPSLCKVLSKLREIFSFNMKPFTGVWGLSSKWGTPAACLHDSGSNPSGWLMWEFRSACISAASSTSISGVFMLNNARLGSCGCTRIWESRTTPRSAPHHDFEYRSHARRIEISAANFPHKISEPMREQREPRYITNQIALSTHTRWRELSEAGRLIHVHFYRKGPSYYVLLLLCFSSRSWI